MIAEAEQLALFELDGDETYSYGCGDPECTCNNWQGYCGAQDEYEWQGPKCGCPGADIWFDRTLCPEPCGMMHNRCTECGKADGYCSFEDGSYRPDWDNYFLGIAIAVAARSDCIRRKVGAIVVKDRRIRGSGYNGAPPGQPGCSTCPRALSGVEPGSSYDTGPGSCVAVHAEANALVYSDRADLQGAVLYLTDGPCVGCIKLIRAAGIIRVVWPNGDLRYV